MDRHIKVMEDLVIKIVDVTLRVIVLSFEPDEFYGILWNFSCYTIEVKSYQIKFIVRCTRQARSRYNEKS